MQFLCPVTIERETTTLPTHLDRQNNCLIALPRWLQSGAIPLNVLIIVSHIFAGSFKFSSPACHLTAHSPCVLCRFSQITQDLSHRLHTEMPFLLVKVVSNKATPVLRF